MHHFTQEDLLEFAYDETSPERTAAIKAALENDWSLREKLDLITSAQKELDSFEMSPRIETLDNILNYAGRTVTALQHH